MYDIEIARDRPAVGNLKVKKRRKSAKETPKHISRRLYVPRALESGEDEEKQGKGVIYNGEGGGVRAAKLENLPQIYYSLFAGDAAAAGRVEKRDRGID